MFEFQVKAEGTMRAVTTTNRGRRHQPLIESQINAQSSQGLERIRRLMSQSEKILFGILPYSNPASDWKKVQFTPYPLVKELISDDVPMEIRQLKFAVHS